MSTEYDPICDDCHEAIEGCICNYDKESSNDDTICCNCRKDWPSCRCNSHPEYGSRLWSEPRVLYHLQRRFRDAGLVSPDDPNRHALYNPDSGNDDSFYLLYARTKRETQDLIAHLKEHKRIDNYPPVQQAYTILCGFEERYFRGERLNFRGHILGIDPALMMATLWVHFDDGILRKILGVLASLNCFAMLSVPRVNSGRGGYSSLY